jgi:transposase
MHNCGQKKKTAEASNLSSLVSIVTSQSLTAPVYSMAKLTEEQRIRIISLSGRDKNQRQIAAEVGCSQTEVSFTVRHFAAFHTVRDLPRSGRPRKLDDRDVLVLRRQLRTKTATTARVDIIASGYGNVSKKTITRILRRRGMDGEEPRLARPRNHLSPLNWARFVVTCECMF